MDEMVKNLYGGTTDGQIYQWDINQKKSTVFKGHRGRINSLLLDNVEGEQNILVSASDDSTVKVWDIRASTNPVFTFSQHQGPINTVSISPDGNWVASGGAEGALKIWEINSGKLITELT
jgi:WD40 repeat protein